MPHFHTLLDGVETSTEIIDPDDSNQHWHTVNGEQTSTDPFGPGHTHTVDSDETSGPIEKEKSNTMNMETKHIGGNVQETKIEDRNGVSVGIIAGYIATWDIDRGNWGVKDRFVRGAFAESIREHQNKGRQVRFKDHHGRTIGGFPPDTLKEDEIGLFGIAEVNLEVQQGREAFSLAKQGVLTDFSVGFSSVSDSESRVDDDRIRTIEKAILWEGSIVDEPMNPKAKITEVKSMEFKNLPIADRETPWNEEEAMNNLKTINKGRESAFLLSDGKMLIADIVDGKLTVIPKALFLAAASIENQKDLPEDIKSSVISTISKYYEKMGLSNPFEEEIDYSVETTVRNVERALKIYGFSKSEAKSIASQINIDNGSDEDNTSTLTAIYNELKSLKGGINPK